MKIYSKDGVEMMEVKSIDKQGDVLVIKGKMMGTMAATLHVTPQTLWEALALLPWSTRLALPLMLLKGRKAKGNAS